MVALMKGAMFQWATNVWTICSQLGSHWTLSISSTLGDSQSLCNKAGPWITLANEAPSHALLSDMFVVYVGPGLGKEKSIITITDHPAGNQG